MEVIFAHAVLVVVVFMLIGFAMDTKLGQVILGCLLLVLAMCVTSAAIIASVITVVHYWSGP